jgi:hypothetical protein
VDAGTDGGTGRAVRQRLRSKQTGLGRQSEDLGPQNAWARMVHVSEASYDGLVTPVPRVAASDNEASSMAAQVRMWCECADARVCVVFVALPCSCRSSWQGQRLARLLDAPWLSVQRRKCPGCRSPLHHAPAAPSSARQGFPSRVQGDNVPGTLSMTVAYTTYTPVHCRICSSRQEQASLIVRLSLCR